MRAISAAVVLLSGIVLASTALAVGHTYDTLVAGIIAIVLILLGLITWLVAFFADKDRS